MISMTVQRRLSMLAVNRMTRLTPRGRKRIKRSNFALPRERKYPIHDIAHARNALARVAQYGTASEKRRVRAAVARKYPSLRKRGR